MAKFDVSKLLSDGLPEGVHEKLKGLVKDGEIDPKALAKEAGEPVKKALLAAFGGDEDDPVLRHKHQSYERALSGTVDALKQARDPASVARLQADLDRFLPSWRAGILAEAASEKGSDLRAGLEATLDVAVKVAVTVAKAFV